MKTTLLESIAQGKPTGMPGTSVEAFIQPGISGYYRQDFSTLNFEDTVYDSLMSVMKEHIEERMRSTAAGFLYWPRTNQKQDR